MLDVVKLEGNIHCYLFLTFTAVLWCLCLLLMSFQCAFAGTCWHLRRLDWCEDVGEPLMDEVSDYKKDTLNDPNHC